MFEVKKIDLNNPIRKDLQKYLVLTDINEIKHRIEQIFKNHYNNTPDSHKYFKGFMSKFNRAYFGNGDNSSHLNKTTLEVLIDYSNLINTLNEQIVNGNSLPMEQLAFETRKNFKEKFGNFPNELIDEHEINLNPSKKTLEKFLELVKEDKLILKENPNNINYDISTTAYVLTNNIQSKLDNAIHVEEIKINKYYNNLRMDIKLNGRRSDIGFRIDESYQDERDDISEVVKNSKVNLIDSIELKLYDNINQIINNSTLSKTKK